MTTVHAPALRADSSVVVVERDSIVVVCEDPELRHCQWKQVHRIHNRGEQVSVVAGSAGADLVAPEVRVLDHAGVGPDRSAGTVVDSEAIH